MITGKNLYQFGNADEPRYIFFKQDFEGIVRTGNKEISTTSSTMDGDIRMNGMERNKKTSYYLQYKAKDTFFSGNNIDNLNTVFFDKPRKTFFYQFADWVDESAGEFRNINKFFFNTCDLIATIPQKEKELDNRVNTDLEIDIAIKPFTPYFYDCSDSLEVIDYSTISLPVLNQVTLGQFTLGGDGSSYQDFSNLTEEEKLSYFTNLFSQPLASQGNEPNYFVYLRDRFFDRDTTQTNRKYLINQLVNSNSQVDLATTEDLGSTSAENRIYRIEILGGMTQNQELEILNLSNNSGLKIKWLSPTTSNATLVFNSAYNTLYSSNNEDDIDSNLYSTDYPDNSDSPLYFRGLAQNNKIFSGSIDEIRLINSAGNNLTAKIDFLPTFH